MKVLLADDDPVSQHRLQALLAIWGYETQVAGSGLEAWNSLQTGNVPPLIVLDWMMPGMDGVEVCRKLRLAEQKTYAYVILLTGKDRQVDIVRGLEAGADDYITKPFDAHELRARLNTGRRIITLQHELIATREELRVRATRDGLTGLWNRAAIMELLQVELSRAQREAGPGVVLLLDMDHFKAINDTHGHHAGDAVLCQTSGRMRDALRSFDGVGRYGGEEFLIVLPGCEMDDAMKLAERVRTAICEPMEIPGRKLTVTCSMGIAAWNGGCEVEMHSLLRAADTALYRAKNAGRNRIEITSARELRLESITPSERVVLPRLPVITSR